MGVGYEKRLEILQLHADKEDGSGYWQDFFRNSKYSLEDIAREPFLAGCFDLNVLRENPLEYFIPSKVLESKESLVVGETSGFSGDPIVTVFSKDEFVAGFVSPFIKQAQQVGFPVRENWLWGGPTGPHIIGKAVDEILHVVGGFEPFKIDFDPRWYKKMPEDSLNRSRYFNHLLDQMQRHLERQNVGVLFTTPPLITALAGRISSKIRNGIKGVHYGGMAISAEQYVLFKELFPNAVHMSGYGNSLFGMYPESNCSDLGIHYKTNSDRLDLDVVEVIDGKIKRSRVGERGRVMLSRYDKSMLLLNVLERDEALRSVDGIIDPRPPKDGEKKVLY